MYRLGKALILGVFEKWEVDVDKVFEE